MDSHFAVLDKRTAKLSKERVTLQHQDWTTVTLNSKKTKATKAPTAQKTKLSQKHNNETTSYGCGFGNEMRMLSLLVINLL